MQAPPPPTPQPPQKKNSYDTSNVISEQIRDNMKNVIKGLHLYDYNRDGHIQKHELRKVLENYCFKMTDEQFDK